MRSLTLLGLAVAAALCGVPSAASASGTPLTDASASAAAPFEGEDGVPEPSRDAIVIAPPPRSHPGPSAAPAKPVTEPVEVMLGMAVVALVSGLMLLAGRRRGAGADPSTSADDALAARQRAAEEVAETLRRRTLRRAHPHLDEDPIVTAIEAATPGPSAPVARGTRRPARRPPPA